MSASTPLVTIQPLAVAQTMTVRAEQIRIQNLLIQDSAAVRYLKNIPASKMEIALLHALEVGIVAMQAKERCRP